MYKLAFFAAAAAMAFAPSFAPSTAEAATKVTVNPTYVPAIYCGQVQIEGRLQKGIASVPDWLGADRRTRRALQVSKSLTNCWRHRTAPAGSDYGGYWAKCR